MPTTKLFKVSAAIAASFLAGAITYYWTREPNGPKSDQTQLTAGLNLDQDPEPSDILPEENPQLPRGPASAIEAAAARPNVILIFIDDAGMQWAPVPTPNIAALYNTGTKLGQAYAQPACSPSRSQLLTSQNAGKWGHGFNPPIAVPNGIETWPKLLQSAGVRTGFIGKWHTLNRHPADSGFDESPLWFDAGAHDYFVNEGLLTGNDSQPAPPVADHLTDRFAASAVKFINENKDPVRPFFLYLATNSVHLPDQSEPENIAKCTGIPGLDTDAKRAYCGNVLHLDALVGKVRAAAPPNTLIIFTSDNGCQTYKQPACSSGILKGQKNSINEGGIRVPMIMHWPGVLPQKFTFRQPVTIRDLGPTILAAMQAPSLKIADGQNLIPVLTGQAKLPVRDLVFGRKGVNGSIRRGDWKYLITGELYNLKADPGESLNVAAQNPKVVEELRNARATIVRNWTP